MVSVNTYEHDTRILVCRLRRTSNLDLGDSVRKIIIIIIPITINEHGQRHGSRSHWRFAVRSRNPSHDHFVYSVARHSSVTVGGDAAA